MNSNPVYKPTPQKILLPVVALVLLVGIGIGYGANSLLRQSRLTDVAERGVEVMPFDLDQTTHYFERTDAGGVQTVTADDPTDQEQIGLIRMHLQEEAAKFTRGDFSDPAAIHGEEMPGLAELRAGASRIEVAYSETPGGARVTYTTPDAALVHALHIWFDAQVSDHGEHAEEGMEH